MHGTFWGNNMAIIQTAPGITLDTETGWRQYADGSGGYIADTPEGRQFLLDQWAGKIDNSALVAAGGGQPTTYNTTYSSSGTGGWGGGEGTGYTGGPATTASGSKPALTGDAGINSSAGSSTTNGQNPYLNQMASALTQQMTDGFNRTTMPAIQRSSVLTGGYGGSRQGVLEANATNDFNNSLGSALANLYGNGYNNYLNYDLGQQNTALGYANLDRNINNDNLNWQLQGAQFGLGLLGQNVTNNQGIYNTGTTVQNTPLSYWQQFANQSNAFGQGYGTSSSTSTLPGSTATGVLGGAQLGNSIGSWWGRQSALNQANSSSDPIGTMNSIYNWTD